jgi:hypothetical protein
LRQSVQDPLEQPALHGRFSQLEVVGDAESLAEDLVVEQHCALLLFDPLGLALVG